MTVAGWAPAHLLQWLQGQRVLWQAATILLPAGKQSGELGPRSGGMGEWSLGLLSCLGFCHAGLPADPIRPWKV